MQNNDAKPLSAKESGDHAIEVSISNILRGGLILASTTVTAGAVLFLSERGGEKLQLFQFHTQEQNLCSVSGIINRALSGDSLGLMQLGVLLLLATPFVRVAFAGIAFAKHRDYLYVVISAVVMAALLFGLFSASGG